MHYDIAEKVLIEKCRETILKQLLGIPASMSVLIEDVPQETVSVRRSDFPIRIYDEHGQPSIVLLELKSKWESDVGLQILDYRVRYKQKYKMPVLSFILLLTPSESAIDHYEDEEVRFTYRLVKIYEIDASRVMADNLTCLMPFIPLMKDGKRYILQAEDGICGSDIHQIDKADMITIMAILSGLVSRELPGEILSRRRNLMIESVAYEILKEEGYRNGWEKGLERGLEKGIEKGMEQGIEQGLEQGIEQGIEKGLERSIRKMMLKGFKPQEIAEILDVAIGKVLKITDFSTSADT